MNSIPHGRLADRLLSEGLLTPKLLEELKREWQKDNEKEIVQEETKISDASNIPKRRSDPAKVKRPNRKFRT